MHRQVSGEPATLNTAEVPPHRRSHAAAPVVGSRSAAWPAYAAGVCAILWGAGKVVYAVQGRRGFPGFPAAGEDNNGQWGLVAMALLSATIALTTVRPWGRAIPRWLLLPALWIGVAVLAVGAAGFILGVFRIVDLFGDEPVRPISYLVAAFFAVWVTLWSITAWFYQRRSRSGR